MLTDIVLKQQSCIKKILADLGYRGFFEIVVAHMHNHKVELSPKNIGEFVIQPKRWIVERTIV